MSVNQKVGVGLLVAATVACALCLIFLPDFTYDEPGRGIFRAPDGSLFVIEIVISLLAAVLIFSNNYRRRKGEPIGEDD